MTLALPGARRRIRLRTILLALLAVLLVTGGWFGWRAYALYREVHTIVGVTVPRATDEPSIALPSLGGNQRINVLVLGSDNDRKPEERRPLTQSMIVVTIDPVSRKIGLLSIPRDFYVPIKGHGYAKIDLANKYGGLQLARLTVERLFGIPIHYYAWVGLSGFTRVIDTFNGINLDVTHPVLDDFYPDDLHPGDPYAFKRVFIPPGWRHLSGRQALEYVRSRHGDLNGDFGRSTRQQQILLQLRQKIRTLDVLTHLTTLVDALQNAVRTDLSVSQVYQLQQFSRGITNADIHRVVLQAPTYCSYAFTPDGQSILRPNWARIRPVVARLFAPIRPASRTVVKAPPTPATTAPSARPTSTASAARRGATSTPTSTPALNLLPASLILIRDGNVFQMNRDRTLRQITTWGAATMPSVSPDEKTIAFVRFGTHYASDIFTVNRLHPGNPVQITRDENLDVHNNLWAVWPAWTADGHILYSTDKAKLAQNPTEIRPVDLGIWSMSPSGSSVRQITLPQRGGGGDTDPVPLPGGHTFLYIRWDYNQSTNQPYSQLVWKNADTGVSEPLTPRGGRVLQPAVDPSGRIVTYVRGRDASAQVVVARLVAAGKGIRLVPITAIATGQVAQPAITPDGKWISFLRGESDGFALYLAPISGGPGIRIDDAGSNLDATVRPVWIR